MKWISFVFSFLFLSLCAFSAPFGLKMGMTAEEVESVCDMRKVQFEDDDWFYFFPVKKHSLFETYIARIDKKFGLYYVRAIGYEIETDGYGTSLKNALDEIKDKLAKSYGEPKFTDELDPNYSDSAIYKYPIDWFDSIIDGHRAYKYVWDNQATLPKDILSIEMFFYVESRPRRGRIVLDYELANHKDIQEEEDTFF